MSSLFQNRQKRDDYRENVEKALREWKDSVRYFESVREPELIDYAVYDMEAARRKYMFLLKRTK